MGGIIYRQHELIKENHLILTQQLFFLTTGSEKKYMMLVIYIFDGELHVHVTLIIKCVTKRRQ